MFGEQGGRVDDDRGTSREEFAGIDEIGAENFRLGHDVRFLFVAVGGGGVQVGREVARHHPRYVETIAIHCDPGLRGVDEFDRTVTLEPELGAEPGGLSEAGALAKAAEPALERIFEGAAFVTIVASLGGSSGTALLPSVVEAASRASVVVSVFAVKPFAVEAERRALAERALGQLHFVEPFVDKQQRGQGRLQVLDNEALASRSPKMPFNGVARHWATLLQEYMDRHFLRPAEAVVEANRLARLAETGPMNPLPSQGAPSLLNEPEPGPLVPENPRLLPAALAAPPPIGDAELTFEIEIPSGVVPPR
jgi:hypothetical protein